MDDILRNLLINAARENISNEDPSHDFEHGIRVLSNAEIIAKAEKADFDIVVPSSLFHDLVVYQKNHPHRYRSQIDSASKTGAILNNIDFYPKQKIALVQTCILECSYTKKHNPSTLESKILQDADRLEATGVISIMRTFSSTGQMKRPFYNPSDPFCEHRNPDSQAYALDLFFDRLLKVADGMHTQTAREMAQKRTQFLYAFLDEFKYELNIK